MLSKPTSKCRILITKHDLSSSFAALTENPSNPLPTNPSGPRRQGANPKWPADTYQRDKDREMAKSLRSKREKRLKAIRREIVKPLYDKKEEAKLAAQAAAFAAPKLPVRLPKSAANAMDLVAPEAAALTISNNMDLEMGEDGQSMQPLKPVAKIGKRMKKKIKMAKRNYRAKGKIRKKHNV